VIIVSQQQSTNDVSIDEIPVDIANMQSGDVELTDVPNDIESITRGLAGEHLPTNPLVVLKAARWWYIHGNGGTDSAFRWAIEWVRHLATDTPSEIAQFDEFLAYFISVDSQPRNRNDGNSHCEFLRPEMGEALAGSQ
jgi:hypothetical protein